MSRKGPADSPPPADPSAAGAPVEEDDIDTVPDAVREAARAAFGMRDREADVLELTYDSAFDRGASHPRRLSFGAEDGAPVVELEITEHGDDRRVLVSCGLPDAVLVAVESSHGSTATVVEGDGAWSATGVPSGSCSVVLMAGARRIRTSWTLV